MGTLNRTEELINEFHRRRRAVLRNLKHVNDNKGDVILLSERSGLPGTEFVHQTLGQFGSGTGLVFAHNVFQSLIAECVARLVLSFGKTVGIE